VEKVTDWEQLWRQLVKEKAADVNKQKEGSGDDWAEKARLFNDSVKKRWNKKDSSRSFLVDLLKANPGATVLDIGAGTGSWACMLAAFADKVTAIDPSPAMIAVMKENVRDLGITNVSIVQDSWPGAAVEEHDFSLCSHAMYGCPDFREFVARMEAVTRKCCLLLMRAPVPGGVMDEIAMKVWGQPYDSPNFQIGYNILLKMGIFANVIMEDAGLWKPWVNEGIDEAVIDVKRKLGLNDETCHDDFIAGILKRRLMLKDGKYFWPAGVRSALVYWFK
jgi:SAM-dependent methyltransferase